MNGPCPMVAGVIVLYNPDGTVLENIDCFRPQVERVLVLDNTETPNLELENQLKEREGVEYIHFGKNIGVARALNFGAQKALSQGFQLLVTLDQDSRAEKGMVAALLSCYAAASPGVIGIVAPVLINGTGRLPRSGLPCEPVETAMTSGSLLSLDAYRTVGGFWDELFIDFVDIEYCLRLRSKGYQIVRAKDALLHHKVGIQFQVGPVRLTSHPPIRKYYKTRNRLAVVCRYRTFFPGWCVKDLLRSLLEIGRLLCFEREKAAKLRMMWRGFQDFRRGKFGPYEG